MLKRSNALLHVHKRVKELYLELLFLSAELSPPRSAPPTAKRKKKDFLLLIENSNNNAANAQCVAQLEALGGKLKNVEKDYEAHTVIRKLSAKSSHANEKENTLSAFRFSFPEAKPGPGNESAFTKKEDEIMALLNKYLPPNWNNNYNNDNNNNTEKKSAPHFHYRKKIQEGFYQNALLEAPPPPQPSSSSSVSLYYRSKKSAVFETAKQCEKREEKTTNMCQLQQQQQQYQQQREPTYIHFKRALARGRYERRLMHELLRIKKYRSLNKRYGWASQHSHAELAAYVQRDGDGTEIANSAMDVDQVIDAIVQNEQLGLDNKSSYGFQESDD